MNGNVEMEGMGISGNPDRAWVVFKNIRMYENRLIFLFLFKNMNIPFQSFYFCRFEQSAWSISSVLGIGSSQSAGKQWVQLCSVSSIFLWGKSEILNKMYILESFFLQILVPKIRKSGCLWICEAYLDEMTVRCLAAYFIYMFLWFEWWFHCYCRENTAVSLKILNSHVHMRSDV